MLSEAALDLEGDDERVGRRAERVLRDHLDHVSHLQVRAHLARGTGRGRGRGRGRSRVRGRGRRRSRVRVIGLGCALTVYPWRTSGAPG